MKKIKAFMLLMGLTVSLFAGEVADPDPSKKIKTKRSPGKIYSTYFKRDGNKMKPGYKNKLYRVYKKGKISVQYNYFEGYPGTGKKTSTEKHFYNKKGLRTELRQYSKGKLNRRFVFTYDKKGRLVKQVIFRGGKAGKPITIKYKLGKEKKILESRDIYSGKVVKRKSYKYSPKGYKVKVYYFDSKNRIKSVKTYDINEKVIQNVKFFYMFKAPSKNTIEYKYDKYGNRIEKIVYNGKGVMTTKTKYRIVY